MAETAQLWQTYCGSAPEPAELLSRWNFDPWLLAGIVAASIGYAALAGRERGRDGAFAALMLALLVLFVSPFCALSAALFTARVLHHLALVFLVAPLLAALMPAILRRVGGSLALWTALQAIVFWIWHAPGPYAAALSHDALFWAMQVSIAVSSALWWRRLMRAQAADAVANLLVAMVLMGLLGALLTFMSRPIYAPHSLTTQAWGFAPLEDQQIGGVLMWAPGSLLYLIAALTILSKRLFHRDAAGIAR